MPEKILVVDDDLDTVRLVGLMLQRLGYEIRAAGNGLQALEMAHSDKPDLILLDIMMPDIDGYEVARRLRADALTTGIPIIMFTAKNQVDDKMAGFRAGADDYLTKPTRPKELADHLEAVLAHSKKAHPPLPTSRERGFLIGLLSARGGLGVSTLALNLGQALVNCGEGSVLLADFRPGQGTISLDLGYVQPEGLIRLLQQKATEINSRVIENELATHPSGLRLLLSSNHPRDARYSNKVANFEAIARQLPYLAHYVILDLGPALSPITEKVFTYCDELVLVVEPVPETLAQSKLLLDELSNCGVGEGQLHIVLVNRYTSGMQLSSNEVQVQLGREVFTVFPPAPKMPCRASENNPPLVTHEPDGPTAQQFDRLAERIIQRKR